jgi:hypothetical protein
MNVEHKYYVYVLSRADGTPFYVGMGSGDRMFRHDREARSGHHCPKCHTIREIWAAGQEIVRTVLFSSDDRDVAYEHEKAWIAHYGRNNLTNQTDGGKGCPGNTRQFSALHRQRLSMAHRGIKPSQETLAKRSAALKRAHSNRPKLTFSPEALARIGAASRGRKAPRHAHAKQRKLTYEQAVEVRTLFAKGGFTKNDLGQRFGVSRATIRKIIAREVYKDV